MNATTWATRTAFVTLGAIYGTWAIRIPDVARHAHVDDARLGTVLLVLAAGSLLGMPLAGRVLRLMHLPVAITGTAAALASSAIALSSARSFPTLTVGAAAFGVVNGAYGVVINTAATTLEATAGRRVVSSCHASFSVATLSAAVIGGVAIDHLAPWQHVAAAGALCVGAMLAAARHLPQAARPEQVDAAAAQPEHRENAPTPHGATILAACALAFIALFAEGVVTDWSATFMQGAVLGHAGPQQSWAYDGFSVAMAAGRAAGDRFLAWRGERTVLAVSLTLALVGYAIMPATHAVWSAVAAFVLIGAGLSTLYPAMISLAAARVAPGEQHRGVAAVSGVGYFGFLAGPGLIGFAAHTVGLRAAMAVPAFALAAGVLLFALTLGRRDQAPT